MCDYASYREQGYEPRQPDELDEDPLRTRKAHPVTKKKKTTIKQVEREYTGIEFLNDVVR